MLTLSCLCGAIRVETAKRPDFIHECNCTLCSKSGARWGSFHPVRSDRHRRDQRLQPGRQGRSSREHPLLPKCGATTHFVLTDSAVAKFGNSVMGVNAWLADESDLAGLELRYPDGRGRVRARFGACARLIEAVRRAVEDIEP